MSVRQNFFTATCYFFRLPRELRNRIFFELWSFTPLVRTHFHSVPTELHLHGHEQHSKTMPSIGLPLWLLTCTSFLVEGMEEFNQLFDSSVGPHYGRMSEQYIHTTRIDPAARGALTICVGPLSTYGFRNTRFAFSDTDVDAIEYILDRTVIEVNESPLMVPRSKLNRLRIKAAFTNVCVYCQSWSHYSINPGEWMLDLSPLLDFHFNLDILEFELTGVDTMIGQDGYSHASNCWDRVKQAFEREVKHVGERCTGDRNGRYSVTTSSTPSKDITFRFTRSKG